MAQPLKVEPITGCAVQVGGTSLFGLVGEIKVDEIKYVMADHNALGNFFQKKVPVGIEAIEGSMKLTTENSVIMAKLASPMSPIQMIASCNKDKFGGPTVLKTPIKWVMTVMPKSIPSGLDIKAQAIAEFNWEFVVESLEIVDNGVTILKVNINSNIFEVNGVSQLTAYNANLAL